MFKVLVLQTLYTLSDDQTECQLRDRWSFMRFLGLGLADTVPDAKTIWLFREQLARAGATERLFTRFDALLRAKGWLAMGGQIVDATVIAARRPRLIQAEKDILKGGGMLALLHFLCHPTLSLSRYEQRQNKSYALTQRPIHKPKWSGVILPFLRIRLDINQVFFVIRKKCDWQVWISGGQTSEPRCIT